MKWRKTKGDKRLEHAGWKPALPETGVPGAAVLAEEIACPRCLSVGKLWVPAPGKHRNDWFFIVGGPDADIFSDVSFEPATFVVLFTGGLPLPLP
jgi:hypothetical protein